MSEHDGTVTPLRRPPIRQSTLVRSSREQRDRIADTLRLAERLGAWVPLSEVAEGYAAMDERRAIKSLLRPDAS